MKARFDSTAAQAPAAAGDGDGVAAGATEARRRTRSLDLDTLRVVADRYGILIAWAIVIAVFGVLEPDTFLTTGILNAILGTQAVLLMLALGVMIPLTVGEFDLSVAGTLGLSYVLIGYLTINHHWPLEASILVALATGVVVGAVNAFFIVGLGVESIIVTLGMGTFCSGSATRSLSVPWSGFRPDSSPRSATRSCSGFRFVSIRARANSHRLVRRTRSRHWVATCFSSGRTEASPGSSAFV